MKDIRIWLVGAILLSSCGPEGASDVLTADQEATEAHVWPDSLTFWEHAAPIVAQKCTPCHHEGGAGPFALRSYGDFEMRLKTVRLAIADGYMPPWPADPTYQRYKDEKFLSALEKETMLRWISGGALEGTPPAEDRIPLDAKVWSEPDLIIPLPDTVWIKGSNLDRFYMAKVGFELPHDTVVAAIGFKPGNKRLVHHVNGHLLNYDPSLKRDLHTGTWLENAEVRSSLSAYKDMHVAHDDGSYPPMLVSAFNYLPGTEPMRYPAGIGGIHVSRKAAFLLNTLHYGPSPVDTFDLSEIHLYYAEARPERPLRELHLGTQGETPVVPEFVIPAGEVSQFSTRYRVTEDLSVLTVNPHMHLLGKSFKAYAVGPEGRDTIPLVHIPEWDFRWQYFYTFRHMLKVPKGFEIVAEATFDNTIHNPYNPHSPPKTLRAAGRNMKTTDEMFQFFVNYVPYREGDEHVPL